jgi:type IV pilus assembly protein PilW
VIAFRAQYGMSASGSPALASWESPSGSYAALTPTTLTRVKAVRIAAVTRSAQPEKPDANGVCQATTQMPTLFGSAVTADVTDWRCYRYRTVTVVVPLRNLLY